MEVSDAKKKLIDAIGECEQSRPSANRYGIMCWTKEGRRYLCKMTEEEAQAKVGEIIDRYKGKTLGYMMHRYSPLDENSIDHHYCVANNAGITLNTRL